MESGKYYFIITMKLIFKNNKLVTIIEPKTISFDLPKNKNNSPKHETSFIIK